RSPLAALRQGGGTHRCQLARPRLCGEPRAASRLSATGYRSPVPHGFGAVIIPSKVMVVCFFTRSPTPFKIPLPLAPANRPVPPVIVIAFWKETRSGVTEGYSPE